MTLAPQLPCCTQFTRGGFQNMLLQYSEFLYNPSKVMKKIIFMGPPNLPLATALGQFTNIIPI